jgi:hypothetical protein
MLSQENRRSRLRRSGEARHLFPALVAAGSTLSFLSVGGACILRTVIVRFQVSQSVSQVINIAALCCAVLSDLYQASRVRPGKGD